MFFKKIIDKIKNDFLKINFVNKVLDKEKEIIKTDNYIPKIKQFKK